LFPQLPQAAAPLELAELLEVLDTPELLEACPPAPVEVLDDEDALPPVPAENACPHAAAPSTSSTPAQPRLAM
jgi:hypothetical protein